MTALRRRRAAVLLVVTALVLVACRQTSARLDVPASSAAAGLTGPLLVFAAASLTEALDDAKGQLEAAHSGLRLRFSYAGSQTLGAQIRQGAPADVFASADEDTMNRLAAEGLVAPPRVLARNSLTIAVAPGNPRRIGGLADLARPDLRVVLCAPTVPAGAYTRQALIKAGVSVQSRSEELDVKGALSKVVAGEADAAVVYRTDVRSAQGRTQAVDIPADHNVTATYLIATVRTAANRVAAQAFVEEAIGGVAQRALLARGFLPP